MHDGRFIGAACWHDSKKACQCTIGIRIAHTLAGLSIGAPCLYIPIPCFWTVPPRFLRGSAAAIGIAPINSLGNVGGFLAQDIMPWVGRFSGGTLAPLLVPACCLLLFGGATFFVSRLAAFRAMDAMDRAETV